MQLININQTHLGQLTGVNVVDECIFKLEGRCAQLLQWEEHGFRIFIPEEAFIPYETCHVTVSAIVGGRFQFPEGTEPVSAVYGISFSRQLCKPARVEMQHCVKLENPDHSKFMSFAVASQDPSSVSYCHFHKVPGGSFKENTFFGSVNQQQFSFMTIIWKLLGYGKNTHKPKVYDYGDCLSPYKCCVFSRYKVHIQCINIHTESGNRRTAVDFGCVKEY